MHNVAYVFPTELICNACPQEEELRKGGEAKYAHLSMELHVFIEVTAPIPEAYLRMAHAMDEVKKFLIPVCVQRHISLKPHHGAPEDIWPIFKLAILRLL